MVCISWDYTRIKFCCQTIMRVNIFINMMPSSSGSLLIVSIHSHACMYFSKTAIDIALALTNVYLNYSD